MAVPSARSMCTDPRPDLWNVYWIGGAADAGKSTVTNLLAERHGFAAYHYDRAEMTHHWRLPDGVSAYRALMDASMDERWVDAESNELFARVMASFHERWPLVLEDLRCLATRPVIAEGFGLLPELVGTVASPEHVVFLIPSEEFKAFSVARRDKPQGRHQTRDPGRARRNMLNRDALIAQEVRVQAETIGMRVVEVQLGRSAESLGNLVAEWFHLPTLAGEV